MNVIVSNRKKREKKKILEPKVENLKFAKYLKVTIDEIIKNC